VTINHALAIIERAAYKAGPTRKVPGRKGMSFEVEDWIDEEATSHRGTPDVTFAKWIRGKRGHRRAPQIPSPSSIS